MEYPFKQFLDDLYIIIVLYKCPLIDSKSFKSLYQANTDSSVLDLFVYDNSPSSSYNDSINKMPKFNIHYELNIKNEGLSKAYNQGAKQAVNLNKKWILLLDQDTIFDKDFLEEFNNSINYFKDIKLFAPILKLSNNKIFSPSVYFFKRGFSPRNIDKGINSFKMLSPVNSGLLIEIEAFMNVGGYNENVKLDFSDFQFIERFRKKNDNFVVVDTIGYQDFSDHQIDPQIALNRYKIYCEGAKACEKRSVLDHLQYFLITLIRGIKLTIRFKRNFLKTWYTYFIIDKENYHT